MKKKKIETKGKEEKVKKRKIKERRKVERSRDGAEEGSTPFSSSLLLLLHYQT